MKYTAWIGFATLIFCGASLGYSQSQPLGDYARAARKDKKPSAVRKFDNDNLPTTDKLSVVGATPAAPEAGVEAANSGPAGAAAAAESTSPAAEKKADTKTAADPAARQKANDQWKEKISTQRAQIDLLMREMDVLQREYRLRAAAFYADAGNRLRNSASWDKEDQQYKQQLDQKQRALDDAKQKLDDLQEQARKAGVPSSARE
ncbi:MAG: hypothetical protein JOY93_06385 [Acidobacteriales bacterium]|nr:hypothetical protein [Terriglobales bacterium]